MTEDLRDAPWRDLWRAIKERRAQRAWANRPQTTDYIPAFDDPKCARCGKAKCFHVLGWSAGACKNFLSGEGENELPTL